MNKCEFCAADQHEKIQRCCKKGVSILDEYDGAPHHPPASHGCTLWEGKPVEFEARVELGQIHYDASVYSGAPHIVLPYPKGLEMVRRKVHVTLRYIEEE